MTAALLAAGWACVVATLAARTDRGGLVAAVMAAGLFGLAGWSHLT